MPRWRGTGSPDAHFLTSATSSHPLSTRCLVLQQPQHARAERPCDRRVLAKHGRGSHSQTLGTRSHLPNDHGETIFFGVRRATRRCHWLRTAICYPTARPPLGPVPLKTTRRGRMRLLTPQVARPRKPRAYPWSRWLQQSGRSIRGPLNQG